MRDEETEERVARAIWTVRENAAERNARFAGDDDFRYSSWDDVCKMGFRGVEEIREQARAALAAVREAEPVVPEAEYRNLMGHRDRIWRELDELRERVREAEAEGERLTAEEAGWAEIGLQNLRYRFLDDPEPLAEIDSAIAKLRSIAARDVEGG